MDTITVTEDVRDRATGLPLRILKELDGPLPTLVPNLEKFSKGRSFAPGVCEFKERFRISKAWFRYRARLQNENGIPEPGTTRQFDR